MLKKTIVYENPFTKQMVSEDHYFHISKADLIEMEMEEHGATYTSKDGETLRGMQARLQRMIDSEDGKAIISELKAFVQRAYGKKEGDRFLKSKEIWEDFAATEAFSQLLWDLCTDAYAAAEFTNGIIPGNIEDIAEEIRTKAEQARVAAATPASVTKPNGDQPVPQVLTKVEIEAMDSDELKSGLATGRYKLS